MFIGVKKANLNPVCEEDVCLELPEECHCPPRSCGKGVSCGVVFYHPEGDISLVAHGDDFTSCGLDENLKRIKGLMQSWFEIKVRAVLGPEEEDDKE
eukprot:3072839-Karenia_brevis.AAC.1